MTWNALICPKRDFGMLLLQNLENEANMRTIAPMLIENNQETFINKVNSFMDHQCEFGYPSHKRTPIHPGILTMERNYNLTFTGTNPSVMKIQLVDTFFPNGLKKGAVFRVKYSSPQSVVVFDSKGIEIKTRTFKEAEQLVITDTTLKCGDNRWTSVQNTLDFYITNEASCILTLKAVNSIQLSLRLNMSVEDFYSKDSSNQLIYNIAAILGIPVEQIRITGILKGSAIVLTQILEKIPKMDEITTVDSTSTSTSTSTSSTNTSTSLTFDGKLNLKLALDTIISSIQTGGLSLPAPVLDLKYSVVSAVTTTPTPDPIPTAQANNSTSPANVTVVEPPKVNTENNNPSGFINITTPDNLLPLFNTTFSENKNNTNMLIIQKNDDMNNFYKYLIILGLAIPIGIVILVGSAIGVVYLVKKPVIKKSTEYKDVKYSENPSENATPLENVKINSPKNEIVREASNFEDKFDNKV